MKILTIILLFISTIAYSQENKRLFIGLNLSPDYAYRTLKTNNSSVQFIQNLRDDSEGPKFGYTGGLNIKYFISQKFAFEAGLQYSNKGYQFKRQQLIFGNMIDPRYEFEYIIIDEAPTHAKILYNFNYLDIPLRYIAYFGNNKIKLVASLGLTTNILLYVTHTNILDFKDGRTERETTENTKDNFKKINFSPTASIGANYSFSEKINLSAEPTFRYGVINIIDAPITAKLWNAGMNFTLYYCLK